MQLLEHCMSMPDNVSLFQRLTDALPFGVYVADVDGTVEYWNHAAELMTGHLSQETLGRRCGEGLLMHCDVTGTVRCNTPRCPVTCAMRDGVPVEGRLFAQHKEGHRIPVVVRVIPLRDEEGAVIAVAQLFQQEDASPEDLSWIDEADSRLDPVLGVYSVATTQKQLRSALACPGSRVAAFLVHIEHLDELAKKHGTEMTRGAQRAVVRTVTRLLNMPHYLGRWDDSSLLVLIPECGHAAFSDLHDRLSSIGNSCTVTWWGDRVDLQVVATGALSGPGDSLETFMERLSPQRTETAAGDV
jgi:PAS domain S-box-containing protein